MNLLTTYISNITLCNVSENQYQIFPSFLRYVDAATFVDTNYHTIVLAYTYVFDKRCVAKRSIFKWEKRKYDDRTMPSHELAFQTLFKTSPCLH